MMGRSLQALLLRRTVSATPLPACRRTASGYSKYGKIPPGYVAPTHNYMEFKKYDKIVIVGLAVFFVVSYIYDHWVDAEERRENKELHMKKLAAAKAGDEDAFIREYPRDILKTQA